MSDHYYASESQWMADGRCRGALETDFVPVDENPADLETVRSVFCDPCPVRVQCLAYALVYRVKGYWGGTMTSERNLLNYTRTRAKCPVCKAPSPAVVDGYEVCLRCGLSWNRDASQEGENHDDGGAAHSSEQDPGRPGGSAPDAGGEPVPARAEVHPGPGHH